MNGSLHLGHAFTISKIEFAAGYQRMLGKRVLFPHAFSVTGIPIMVSADKIVREMEIFGPNFERYYELQDGATGSEIGSAGPSSNGVVGKSKIKESELKIKTTGFAYQFQNMESIGIPLAEIKKFADPYHWLTFFPRIAIEDSNALGCRIDWRRSFLTTDANPYYDSFVRWQVNKLYRLGKIKFSERYTIYSPKDGQPCMDHDRQDGQGVGPQKYTGVKMEVVEWSSAAKQSIENKVGGRTVFLISATLRPETMYGQTNCFVSTLMTYGVFAVNNKEAYLCTYRAARNMAFQGIWTPRGMVNQLAEIPGDELLGTRVKAPFSFYPEVYVLPMDHIVATKGTGVVTSVPSDSPMDCALLYDLRKKPEFYNIDPAWAALDPTPVVSTPTYGDMCAPAVLSALKIQSPKDKRKLAEANAIAYKEGFCTGTMLVGEFMGLRAQDANVKVRERMIEAGLAFTYAEPEHLVISQSADECVVALMEQWYTDYGEEAWRAQVERHLTTMNLNSTETRHIFEAALRQPNKWACARTYGLGSKLPWDPHFLVESLSDSTIYMCYYTVSQLLHENSLDGSKPGPLGIIAEQMTDEIWEYVFCNGPFPDPSPLPRAKADALKHEYNYFYPFDIRSSARDLISNHLSFCLYDHVALLPEDKLPLGMRNHGRLLLNGKVISKANGNLLTLREGVQKFGADVMRLSLADAGDGLGDANFEESSANVNIKRIYALLQWCERIIKYERKLRQGPRTYHDDVFEHEINELINITQSHYEATNYKDAVKYGFYEFQRVRHWYREMTASIGMHADLVNYWMRMAALVISPIAPHFAEHIYTTLLKSPTSIQCALWPTPVKPVDPAVVEAAAYMRSTVKKIRDAETDLVKMLKKAKCKNASMPSAAPFDPKKPKSVRIYVATAFPEWQNECVQVVREAYDEKTGEVDDARVRELLAERGLIKDKQAMSFVQAFSKRIVEIGAQVAFRRVLRFSESHALMEILPYLKKTLGLFNVEVLYVDDVKRMEGYPSNFANLSEPGSPAFEIFNV